MTKEKFEEEAHEFQKQIQQEYLDLGKNGAYPPLWERIGELWGKGAEFGYNKANEWHYVNWKYFADKDYPESETASYLVQLRNKDTLICEWETEEGFGYFFDSNLEPIDNDDVYAWKEIIPPKESK